MSSESKDTMAQATQHETSSVQGDLPAYHDNHASLAPPDYTSRAGSIASATRKPPTAEERATMLQAYALEKESANDNWGGHKGSAGQFEPNDPTRPFRRLSQILRGGEKKGEERISWTKPRTPDDGNRGYSYDGYKHDISSGDQGVDGTKIA